MKRKNNIAAFLRPHELGLKDWENEEKIKKKEIECDKEHMQMMKQKSIVFLKLGDLKWRKYGPDIAGLYKPPRILRKPGESYYGTTKIHDERGIYDRLFTLPPDYDPKVHRTDREYRKNIRMDDEESQRLIPVSTNNTYLIRKSFAPDLEERFPSPQSLVKTQQRRLGNVISKPESYSPANSANVYLL